MRPGSETRVTGPGPSSNMAADWTDSHAWVRVGALVLAGLAITLVLFATVVTINSAVVGSGTVTVENNYRTVQHLDGGIVADILVRNGDEVAAGDVLVRLDKTSDSAELTVVVERVDELRVQRARLEAERDGRDSFDLPSGLTRSPAIEKTIAAQRALFRARMESHRGQMSMLESRITQGRAQAQGLAAQQRARVRERNLMDAELKGVRQLFQRGFANQQRLTALERDAARLDGEVSRLASDRARADAQVSEAQLALAQERKAFLERTIDELRQVQSQLNELEERRKALSARVARAEIRAPSAGRVHALAIHTKGGVIEPARPILQIIPRGERLVVEARIAPRDVDKVRQGQTAKVGFPAFNANQTPRLAGRVTRISPAELQGDQGETYFTAEIEIPPDELAAIGAGQRLVPGMPAEVFITTGARSILSYLLKPLTDAMFRAFREG